MTETRSELILNALPQVIQEPVRFLADHLRAKLADNRSSITVVGSALTGDYRPGISDINTVLVLQEVNTKALNAIAATTKPMRKKHLSPPLLMTTFYIKRSRDVFGVEFLDFQLTHQTVLGNDPFEALAFGKADVRLQCERELKATLIRLQQGCVAAAGNDKLVRDVLIATAKGLAPILRAMLWLKDAERPRTMAATFRVASDAFSVNLNAVVAAEQWRYAKTKLSAADIEAAFESVYAAVDRLATIVDALEVA
jgi:hypothetical protein